MANRNDIFIGIVLFYSIFLGLLGFVEVEGIETTEGDVLDTISDTYTFNESHTDLTYCVVSSNIFFPTRESVVCDDGEKYKPEEVIVEQDNDITIVESGGFLSWVRSNSEFGSTMIDYFDTMFTTISGFPAIFNIILFTPLSIMIVWLIIDFLVWITPFIGGGS